LILPASTAPGNSSENALLPDIVGELNWLGLSAREVALDGGFQPGPTNSVLEELEPERCSSLDATTPVPDARIGGCSATEPARRAGSATSNAATGWAAAA
jgi:hypothetical protein